MTLIWRLLIRPSSIFLHNTQLRRAQPHAVHGFLATTARANDLDVFPEANLRWKSTQTHTSSRAGSTPSTSSSSDISNCRKHLEVPPAVFANGCLLLQQAALGNLAKMSRILKEQPALVNFRDYDRRTALHVAAAEGHVSLCRYLVDQGAQINRSDRWGASPLDDAHRHRHKSVVKLLQSRGGRSGSKDVTSNLITAAAVGDLEEVQALMELGQVDLNQGDYDRRRAIHLASGENQPQMVELLCRAGANVNVEDRWGKRPLDDAQNFPECADILKSYGAEYGSASTLNIDNVTHLIAAAARGDVEFVKMWITLIQTSLTKDSKERNNTGKSLTVVELLNQGDYDRRTPLHLAAGEGHAVVVKLLLETGADANIKDRWGNRPLDDAMQATTNAAACIQILEQYGAKRGLVNFSVEQEALLDLLNQYGQVRNGRLSLDWHNVKDLLKGIGQEHSDEAVQKLFKVADKDGDGTISSTEFMAHSDTFLGGRPARIILVVGGPGSGKGLLCERLVKECGVVHLSSGELLRDEVARGTALGKQVAEMMKRGELVSSAVMVTLMNNRMKDHPGKRILLDGFPRSQENAQDLVTLCGKPELALHLDCHDTTLLERIMKRAVSGDRPDDNFHTALQRIRTYHKYHHLTMDFLREQHVPIVELDCSVTPDGVWGQLEAIGRLMRPAVRLGNTGDSVLGAPTHVEEEITGTVV